MEYASQIFSGNTETNSLQIHDQIIDIVNEYKFVGTIVLSKTIYLRTNVDILLKKTNTENTPKKAVSRECT